MKTEKGKDRLYFFESLYENAKSRQKEITDALELNMSQYRGSTEIDGQREKATAIRNITYELIEAQISSDIPAPRVDAKCYSEKKDRNAKSIERLCSQIRDTLPFEDLNDMDERYTYIYGASIWFVEWDETQKTHSEIGGVKISVINPRDFFPQPDVVSIDDFVAEELHSDGVFIRAVKEVYYTASVRKLSSAVKGFCRRKAERAQALTKLVNIHLVTERERKRIFLKHVGGHGVGECGDRCRDHRIKLAMQKSTKHRKPFTVRVVRG